MNNFYHNADIDPDIDSDIVSGFLADRTGNVESGQVFGHCVRILPSPSIRHATKTGCGLGSRENRAFSPNRLPRRQERDVPSPQKSPSRHFFRQNGKSAAVVLDTGAASRGSGNAGQNKEKTVRQWFVDHDLIESVLYLPENLFYNTTAPGIVLFLNNAKPKAKQGKVLLVNASQMFEKGDPKNFIPDAGIDHIADILIGWQEEDKLSRIVDHAELKKNDYNISPSRYIHTSDAETYRPIGEIVEELKVIELEAKETDKALSKILKQLGV
ncbi:MAG: N-6 DNA methylase [Candidatus Azotimanducaceae bacterium WSBS_2022_MAG_OTU7]